MLSPIAFNVKLISTNGKSEIQSPGFRSLSHVMGVLTKPLVSLSAGETVRATT
jgi:hypothetical protein